MKKRLPSFALSAIFALCLVGCSSYSDNARVLRENWRQGNFAEANAVAGTALEDADETDLLLWQLEHGTTLHAINETEKSSAEFERAAETVLFWEEQPEVLLSKEALAGLTNPTVLPYRGRSSDIIMLHTYRALDFLETGKTDSARVALNAAYQAQRDAVERNAEAIASAQKEAEDAAVDTQKALRKSGLDKKLADRKNALSEVRILADYVNPFTTWLHGIYFLNTGTDGSDFERAKVSLARVAEMYPENPYIAEDLECAKANTPEKAPLTYVIFESGLAPIIGEDRVDTILPLPLGGGDWTVMPFSIALPKLVLSDQRKYWLVFPFAAGSYTVGNANPTARPALAANDIPAAEICDMNSVVRTDFENAFPAILTRTIITATLKSAAAAALNAVGQKFADSNSNAGGVIVGLSTVLATTIYTSASTQADTRCWQTLPQNFSVVRMPTPQSRTLKIRVGSRVREVELRPGQVNLVHVKTTGETGPVLVRQSVLKP